MVSQENRRGFGSRWGWCADDLEFPVTSSAAILPAKALCKQSRKQALPIIIGHRSTTARPVPFACRHELKARCTIGVEPCPALPEPLPEGPRPHAAERGPTPFEIGRGRPRWPVARDFPAGSQESPRPAPAYHLPCSLDPRPATPATPKSSVAPVPAAVGSLPIRRTSTQESNSPTAPGPAPMHSPSA